MKALSIIVIQLFFFCILAFSSPFVTDLVCEYHTNPIGIDVAKPRFSWQIKTSKENFKQIAYEIRVGKNIDNKTIKTIIWSSGKIASDQSVNVEYEGEPLNSMQRAYWQVRIWDNDNKVSDWSEPAFWEMGILDTNLWSAKWICRPGLNNKIGQVNYFRREFTITKKIKSARVYATSLGIYQLFMNGKKISNDLFTPGWTAYEERLQYQTYDVTDVVEDANSIGVILGEGWYSGPLGRNEIRNNYGDSPAALVQLVINYTDGSSSTIISDENWKASNGPIIESTFYDGETYDARLEDENWANKGFDDSQWQKASILDHRYDILVASQGVPVKAIEEIAPIEIITTPNGETVLDMGQNMVGWIRVKVSGKKGDKVTMRFAELLDKEGNFYVENLCSAAATDVYILNGEAEEVYEPHFTYHGFRYVDVSEYPGEVKIENFTGVVIHSDMKATGSFVCSDSLINKLQSNIIWSQKGNFFDIPTDCPQRNERLGWTGDAQIFAATAAYNYDVSAFFTKWLKDLAVEQYSDGRLPNIVPNIMNGSRSSAAWSDVCIILPWTIYQVYNDKRILEEQYESMKSWVEYMRKRAGDKCLWIGDNHFGDWMAFASTQPDYPGATTDKDLIATAYYYYSTYLLSKIAKVLQKDEDATTYSILSQEIKKAFNLEFVTTNGRLMSNTQTAYALALSFGLLPDSLLSKSSNFLAQDVEKLKHLTTGFVGTPLLCKALSDNGYKDLAYMVLMRKEYPSWLYPITKGATTIWERWDGIKPDGSLQSPRNNSLNHYAYGAIGEWLYSYVAGLKIDPENPGYKHIIFDPQVGGGLTFARSEFYSMYGKIKSEWKINENRITYSLDIPPNTTGTVKLPKMDPNEIVLNSVPLSKKRNIEFVETPNNLVVKLGSGSYQITSPLN